VEIDVQMLRTSCLRPADPPQKTRAPRIFMKRKVKATGTPSSNKRSMIPKIKTAATSQSTLYPPLIFMFE
jgi:hypothetical protein